MGSPGGSAVKSLPANAVDTGLIPGSGRSPGKGNGNPRLTWKVRKTLSGKPHGRGGWWATLRSGFLLTFERNASEDVGSFRILFGGWTTPLYDVLWTGPPGTSVLIRVPSAKPFSQQGNDLIPIEREAGAVVTPHQR